MTNDQDNKLDGLLRNWAKQNSATDADIQALCDRISRAVDQAPFLDAGPATVRTDRFSVLGRAVWFSLGCSVALLFAFLLFPAARVPQEQQAGISETHQEVNKRDPEVPSLALLNESQLAGKGLLLAEMERMFADRLTWVAESDGQVCVGLLPQAGSAPSEATPMAVRVVVVSRKGDQEAWTPVWQIDVVTRGEELVDLTQDCIRSGTLSLWTYPLPDGKIAVDANFALPGPVSLESSFSGVQSPGVPKEILSIGTDRAEYRVFQTVSLLREGTG